VDLEIKFPAERGLLIQTPNGICTVRYSVPCLIVEAFGLFRAAEQQRQGELSLICILWLIDEVDERKLLVKAPGPEVCAVYEFVSYPDFHGRQI
jgi:hypothetical protein